MTAEELIKKIMNILSEAVISVSEMPNNDIMIEISKDEVIAVMERLKEDPEMQFDSLLNQMGVDYGEKFAVIYNLFSFTLDRKITVKAYIDRQNPEIVSIEAVFRGVNWFERETYDMFGINFTGHSNLKRLLLPEDWEGHPLRKDYVYPEQCNGVDNKPRSNFK
jgi:NADH-quinone oxidoreductase subunit C